MIAQPDEAGTVFPAVDKVVYLGCVTQRDQFCLDSTQYAYQHRVMYVYGARLTPACADASRYRVPSIFYPRWTFAIVGRPPHAIQEKVNPSETMVAKTR